MGTRAGLWVGDCFVYNNSAWRLNYCVGGEVTVMYHLDRPMYLLGYLTKEAKVYLIDKDFGVISHSINLAMIEYKTLIIRGELDAAQATLSRVPKVPLLPSIGTDDGSCFTAEQTQQPVGEHLVSLVSLATMQARNSPLPCLISSCSERRVLL